MASFITTPAQLRAKAEELSSLNNSFKTNVSELEAEEQNLMGMWEGQAKEAFHQAFSSVIINLSLSIIHITAYRFPFVHCITNHFDEKILNRIETHK